MSIRMLCRKRRKMNIKKSVTLKPVILIEVVMVVVLAGAGVAVAFTSGSSVADTGGTSTEGGIQYTQTVGNSDVTVASYTVQYDTDLDAVTGVTAVLAGTDGDKCYVTATAGDDDFSPSEKKQSSITTISGATSCAITFTTPLATSNFTKVNFLVEKSYDAG